MLIVGERINTSRKPVNEAVEKRDAAYITADVQKQVKAGVDYIDVNSGSRIGSEMEDLGWLVDIIEAAVNVPLALDSPDPKVLLAMMKRVKQNPIINSTTAEASRFEAMKAVVQERECDLVALCMDERGIPRSVDQILENASSLVQNLTKLGMSIEKIHLDPMIQPISVNKENGTLAVETIRRLHREFPGVKTICGLSNISFGLPNRFLVNRLFMVLCIGAGLTGALVDPLDQKMMTNILVAETLAGKDNFCLKYLKASRAGTLVGQGILVRAVNLGTLNFLCGVILLALLVWAASGGMASAIAPGNLFIGLLGAAFLLAAFLYFLLRRTRIFSQSKGIVADPLILLGSVGFGRGGWGWLPVSSHPVLSILSLKS